MRIGWIGTGVMGAPMATHLVEAGHDLAVFNRTAEKAAGLLDRGATWCTSPEAVAQQVDIVFSIVGFPSDVREIYLGANGILRGKPACGTVIDMTTSEPSLAVEIAEQAARLGIVSLDAPVSGGDVGARKGSLAIMVGGSEERYHEVLPLLEILGENIACMGGPGAGQHTKMCNQILIAGTMIGVCESLLYASRGGLDQAAVIDIIGKGAAGSWSINNLGPRIVEGDYSPGFYVDHFLKDMGIALRESEAMGLALPGLALVRQLYLAARAQGHGRDGTQALMKALRALNGE